MAAVQPSFPVTEEQLAKGRAALGFDAASPTAVPSSSGEAVRQAEEAPFTVTLSFIGGESSDALEVKPSQCILNVKSRVCNKLGVSNARVKLIFGSSVLRWNDTVATAGLTEGASVTVIVLPPLYEGSEAYEQVATGYRESQAEPPTDEEVREVLEKMMEKKSKLNEAFTASIKLRKARVP